MTRNPKNQVKILIVEDELLVAEQIASYLQNKDYNVLGIVDNGEEAVEFLSQDSPDLILMDIELNGKIDGVEAAASIQEKIYIPIIYLTKLNDIRTLNRVKATMPAAYLTKPFKNHDIRNAIEMAIYNGTMDHQKEARHEIKLNLELDIKNSDGIKHLQDRIFYRDDNGSLKVLLLNELIYLEMEDNVLTAHTIRGSYPIQTNLKQFLSRLANSSLYRIHRQYAINLNYLAQIIGINIILEFTMEETVTTKALSKQVKLPLGVSFKKDFLNFIEDRTF